MEPYSADADGGAGGLVEVEVPDGPGYGTSDNDVQLNLAHSSLGNQVIDNDIITFTGRADGTISFQDQDNDQVTMPIIDVTSMVVDPQ